MKLILIFTLLSSVVLAQVTQPFNFDWSDVKDIWEHPRLQPARQKIESRLDISKSTNSQQRIVGGNYAVARQFPHHVACLIDVDWFCGGSLLNANWVLTAAHCVYQFNSAVILSLLNVNVGYYWTTNTIQFIVHEDYDEETITNDVGLMRLATPAPNNAYTSYISLPTNYVGNSFAGNISTVQGFGLTSDSPGSSLSNRLKYVSQTIMANSACTTWGPISSQLCTVTTGGKGPCSGDSGGALFIGSATSPTNRSVVGIVSYGAAAGCSRGYPAVFTRVPSFLFWINQKMASPWPTTTPAPTTPTPEPTPEP